MKEKEEIILQWGIQAKAIKNIKTEVVAISALNIFVIEKTEK